MINVLKTTKNDIKTAIEGQENGSINGGMTTYAESIRNIKHIKFISDYIVPVGLKFKGSWGYSFDNFDFSNITDMSYMFAETGVRGGVSSNGGFDINYADNIELNETAYNGENCEGMFSSSYYRYLSLLSFPNASNCDKMFYESEAYTIRIASLPNISSAVYMFSGCPNLTTVRIYNMSVNNIDGTGMFSNCPKLTGVSIEDKGVSRIKFTNVNNMFSGCSSLTGFGFSIDVSDLTSLRFVYNGCGDITSTNITGDGSKIKDVTYLFAGCISLKSFGGIKNFGAAPDLLNTLDFSSCQLLSNNSINSIINNLYDRASAGYSIKNITFHKYADISEDDITLATRKGWCVTMS